MLQEERIHLLQNKLDQVKTHTKKCDRLRKKERRFLQTLIEISKRDNVPLSDERCSEFCSKNRVKEVDCKLMCYSSISKTCEDWPNLEKCLKTHPNFNKKNSASRSLNRRSTSSTNTVLNDTARSQSFSLDQKIPFSDDDYYDYDDYHPFNTYSTRTYPITAESGRNNFANDYHLYQSDSTRSQSFSLDQRVPMSSPDLSKIMINISYLGDLSLRTWSPKASCASLTCHLAPNHQATFCFQKTDPNYYFQFGQHEALEGKVKSVMQSAVVVVQSYSKKSTLTFHFYAIFIDTTSLIKKKLYPLSCAALWQLEIQDFPNKLIITSIFLKPFVIGDWRGKI